MVELPYGRVPYLLDLGGRDATILHAPRLSPPLQLGALLDAALDAPLDRPRLEQLVSAGTKVTVIVSDATRAEPRAAFVDHLLARLPPVALTIAIATGTHGPSAIDLPPRLLRNARIVNHDGHATTDLVTLGTTSRGTPVRLHRCVVETDLVIATGCIRPHYFAGFGAGIKAIFPGLGHAPAIRHNHALKTSPRARAGIIDDNPCRDDLDEAVSLLRTPTFLLNGVCGPDDDIHAAVAGDPFTAFRRGVSLARPWFTVRAPRAALVIASDAPPITATLYQAAKIAAACAPLVLPGGALVVVAECADGIGPLETVNEAIFRIGVLPRLPPSASLHLICSLPPSDVAQTLVAPLASPSSLIAAASSILVIPHASKLLFESPS